MVNVLRSTIGPDIALSTISKAVQNALDNHPDTHGQPFQSISFSRVWIGMAGYDRGSLKILINTALSELFTLPLSEDGLTVTTDIDILPATVSSKLDIKSVIVLITGTGSIATSYLREGRHFRRTGRAGGWGRLLGDDGSGYAIGRAGIRKTLRMCDIRRMRKSAGVDPGPLAPLTQAVLDHFQRQHPDCTPESFLDTLLIPHPSTHGEQNRDFIVTKRIASAAEVVLSMAKEDTEASGIVSSAAASVADLVAMLVEGQDIDLTTSAIILGGGLMTSSLYKSKVLGGIEARCGRIAHIELVEEPALVGAQNLLDRVNI